jgi:hypothetical protein
MTDAVRRISVRLSLVDGGIVERQLRDVGRAGDESLGRIRDSAQGASRALDLLDFARRAAGALALGQAVRALVAAGDAYTASLGRLAQALGPSSPRAPSGNARRAVNSAKGGQPGSPFADAEMPTR